MAFKTFKAESFVPCLFPVMSVAYILQMTVCLIFTAFLVCVFLSLHFTATAFLRNPENMNFVGMLMFKVVL